MTKHKNLLCQIAMSIKQVETVAELPPATSAQLFARPPKGTEVSHALADLHKDPAPNTLATHAERPRHATYTHNPTAHETALTMPLHTIHRLPTQTLHTRPLERHLTPGEVAALKHPPKPLTPTEYTRLCHETFKQVFAHEAPQNYEATTTERVRCAWRIVREMARTKKLLEYDEPMIEHLANTPKNILCKFNMPTEIISIPETLNYVQFGDSMVNQLLLQLYNEALNLKQQYWAWCFIKNTAIHVPDTEHAFEIGDEYFNETQTPPTPPIPETVARPGLGLLPPPVPLYHYDNEWKIQNTYDPYKDPGLLMYIRAVGYTADYLGIWQGSMEDPELGRKGMWGMTSPITCRLVFPTKMQIMAWEYLLIIETLNTLAKYGSKEAYLRIKQKYGLQHMEAHGVLKMTQRFAKKLMETDREEARAIMLMRCEEQMRRSRAALDLKAEMNTLKQMSAIMGLTRTEADESMEDFVNIVKATTNERRALTAITPRELPENALEE